MSPIIDARGKACPTPVIMAKKAISAGESTLAQMSAGKFTKRPPLLKNITALYYTKNSASAQQILL